MSNTFNLGRLFGIQFRLHYTWFIIFVFITVSLAWLFFPGNYPGWSPLIYWVVGLITSLLFFASVVAHELAHSLVARVNGIPVKSITLFIFGGIAQITREAAKAGTELKMAAAGPACSLAIGGLFGLLWLVTRGANEPIAAMSLWLAQVNGILAVFNLVPGFPLDGGRVFRSILWHVTGNYIRSTRIATQVGRGVGYLFMAGGILMIFILHEWFSGLWLACIGWFIENAASASYRQTQWHEALRGLTASQVMTSNFPLVSPDVTINQLVEGYIFTGGCRYSLVVDEGRLKGILVLHNIKAVPRPNWGVIRVKDIMVPVDKLIIARPDQDALSIMEQVAEHGIEQIPVISEGRVIGLIDCDNLMKFLRIRSELGIRMIY